MNRHKGGSTLIELLVVLSVLAILASVTVLAARRFDPPPRDDPSVVLAESLRVAVDTPRTIVVRLVRGGAPISAAIRPDGSVVGDSALSVDRFTGRTHAR
jgi:prepilin-type N-terminal cleavage/methylation domain-containing protein